MTAPDPIAALAPEAQPAPPVLAADWVRWVAENLLAGRAPALVVEGLVEAGVPEALAHAEVRAVAASPLFALARNEHRLRRQLEQRATLRLELQRSQCVPGEVERRSFASGQEFIDHYYKTNRPVVWTDLLARSDLSLWSPAALKRDFAATEVEVTRGRDANPSYQQEYAKHCTPMLLGEYIDLVERVRESNDMYMIAYNDVMGRTPLAARLQSLVLPDDAFAPPQTNHHVALWIGPARTLTACHWDQNNVMLCQMHGRKRVYLISPDHAAMMPDLNGPFSPVDPEAPDYERFPWLRQVEIKAVTIGPGEALFLPVGWYHHVRALDISVSVSLLDFVVPNSFYWYKPGSPYSG